MSLKKAMLFILSLAVIIFASACGNTTGSNSTGTTAPGGAAATPETPATPAPAPSSGDEAAEFFKGKTINFIVPYSPGGGYDTIARSLAPKLEKYTGATILVQNVDGGGGNLGTNRLYTAKPDGLTIGILNGGGIIVSQLLGVQGIQFDAGNFSYLGRVNSEARVTYVAGANKEINSIEDVINSKTPIKMGAPGTGDDNFFFMVGLKNALGLPFEFVTGYQGQSNVQLAVMSGEIAGTMASLPSRLPAIKSGELRALLILGEKSADLPDVPTASQYVKGDDGKRVLEIFESLTNASRPIAAPPDLPEDKRLFLEQALNKALTDPELVGEWEKASRPINWMPGKEFQDMVKDILGNPPTSVIDAWKEETSKLNR